MLRIYPVCLEMVRGVRPCVERIGRFDADLARQLRKASTSVALNVAEGSGSRGGKRRHCYDIALGEARETLANLEVAAAVGYMPNIDAGLRRQLNQIIGHSGQHHPLKKSSERPGGAPAVRSSGFSAPP